MKRNTHKYILFIFIFIPIFVFANSNVRFKQISAKEGLSQNTVRTILVDKKGFVWAGTLDGLNRYDGYHIVSFKPQAGNPNSLNDHRIKDVFQDQDGYLWIKTYKNEFSCYNPTTESFVYYPGQKETFFSKSYFEAKNGDIWLWGEDNHCMRIQKKGRNFHSKVFSTTNRAFREEDTNHFLFEDSKGGIWIGGNNGLFTIKDDSLVSVYSHKDAQFTKAVEVSGKLYFTTSESILFVCDLRTKKFSYQKLNTSSLKNAIVKSANEIFLIAQDEVLVYNILSQKITQTSWQGVTGLHGEIDYVEDSQSGIWFFNVSGNVWFYNRKTNKTHKLKLIPEETIRVIDAERYSVLIDKKGLYWITTYGNGLFCYNSKSDELINYSYQEGKNSLPSNYLLSITQDKYDNIWVGSEFSGIIKVSHPSYEQTVIRPEENNFLGRNNNVRSLYISCSKEIWLGTKKGNLYVYDSNLKHSTCIKENITPYSFQEDANHQMWVGTKGYGLYIFDEKTKREKALYATSGVGDQFKLQGNAIYNILRDNKNRMWLALFPGGIALADSESSSANFRYFFQDQGNISYARCIFQDREGIIWVGTSGGILKFDPDKFLKNPKAFINYRLNLNDKTSLNCNDVKTIYQDKDGQVWIGTAGGGLNLFVPATAKTPEHFEAFTTSEGLSGNIVSGIMEDDANNLWISTENGINRFEKKTHSFVNYYFSDKTFGNHFNENVNAKNDNGEMLWGSLDGLVVFNPKTFVPNKTTPPVTLTNILVNGQPFTVNKMDSEDGKGVSYTKEINLKYNQNTFTIQFSTLALNDPERNSYTYILEKFDKEWSPVANVNSATYKNLSPGKYIFKVKGANSDGVWNDNVTQLIIVITPPFWRSTLAYLIYFVLGVLAIYFGLRLMWKFNRLNSDIELEKKLTNHKLRFFTNISHEFRTPLTLIKGAVENLNDMEIVSPMVKKQVHILSKNSDNLSRLIEQLLEFRKLQSQILTLDLCETDVVAFCRDIFSGFQELAKQKDITFQFSSNVESYRMYIDRRKVDKIFYNLLSNAFKFTSHEGEISFYLTIDRTKNLFKVAVMDSGIGVPKEKQELLFSRFMQINFSSSGTGVGLSLCKDFVDAHKGKIWYEDNPTGGSVFCVSLGLDTSVYKDANFVQEEQKEVLSQDIFNEAEISSIENSEVNLPDLDDMTISNFKLLIVDDNDDIRHFLQDEFSQYFMVDVAEDGKIGLEKAKEYNPDLIICDVMMPEMDGFEVTRQMKSNFETCHIPIILLTAHSSTEHKLEGLESGADAYVTKPFSLKLLKTRVFKMMEQRELLKKRFSNEYVLDGNLITHNDKDKEFYDLIEKILEENYAKPDFSVDKFAELAKVRRTIFYKKLKGITGLSPNELIKKKRLKTAAEMLLKGNLTISEVAYNVGFEDPFYFSKCFKTQFGCAPSKYGNKPKEG